MATRTVTLSSGDFIDVNIQTTLDDRGLQELGQQGRTALRAAIRDTIQVIWVNAQFEAPNRTGALANSIYWVKPYARSYRSNYSERRSAALEAFESSPEREGQIDFLDEIPYGWDPNFLWGAVSFSAAHGIFQEYGTYQMAAQPFLGPAAYGAQDFFENEISTLFTKRQIAGEELELGEVGFGAGFERLGSYWETVEE